MNAGERSEPIRGRGMGKRCAGRRRVAGAQRPQKRLTNGVSGVKCDGRWRTNLQPGELGVLLGAPHAGALSVGHLNCLVSRLLGRVRDYTPRSMRRRRANVNAAGVQRSSSGDEKTPTMEARLIAVLRCAREPKRRADGRGLAYEATWVVDAAERSFSRVRALVSGEAARRGMPL